MKQLWLSPWTKAAVFALSIVPVANLLWRGFHQKLTANPIEFLTHQTGTWALRFLLVSLAITPLRALLKQPQLIRFRRMLGLFAFFYATLHFAVWVWLDKTFDGAEMLEDIVKRRFITVGMAGLLLMVPLALTSTARSVRRLGYVRWQRLHRLVYLTALAGILHYFWLVKSDLRSPSLYAFLLAALMLTRLISWRK